MTIEHSPSPQPTTPPAAPTRSLQVTGDPAAPPLGWVTCEGIRTLPPPPLPEPTADDRIAIRRELAEWLDRHDRFEWHEKAWELGDEQRYWSEVELWQLIVEREPENARNYLHLLDAWRRVGRPAQALEAASILLECEDRCPETEQALVEVMEELGRDWRELPWRERPRVRRLDETLCRELLERLAGDRSFLVSEQWIELFLDGVCLFDIEELTRFLEGDTRFEVERDRYDTLVSRTEEES